MEYPLHDIVFWLMMPKTLAQSVNGFCSCWGNLFLNLHTYKLREKIKKCFYIKYVFPCIILLDSLSYTTNSEGIFDTHTIYKYIKIGT